MSHYTEGTIKTVMYAGSQDEPKGISVNFLLKGRYNTFNAKYQRKLWREKETVKEYDELEKFIATLKNDAGVESIDGLVDQKIKVTWNGKKVESFEIIKEFTPIKK